MQQRHLGASGLTVSMLGLGCSGMSSDYGVPDDIESTATIHQAIDLGVTLFDTSDAYGAGHNETLLGASVRPKRNKVNIATKFGNMRGPNGERGIVNGRPEYVPQACEASLKRLGTDVIDLYYQHRIDPQVPIEETVGAMSRLVEQGKVRFIGLCEAGANTIRRAHAIHPLSAVQIEYSLWTRDVEEEILLLLRELNIGFVPYSPLGRGFLTGSFKSRNDLIPSDRRHAHPRFQENNFESNLQLIAVLEELAAKKECATGQIALAWVLSRGDNVVPIPGTKRRSYLNQNVAAATIKLTDDDLMILEKAFPRDVAYGTRYPAAQLKTLGL